MTHEPNSLPIYVLIGGESRRFGSDKAAHLIDGTPWAMHVGKSLSPDGPLTLVGSMRAGAASLPARQIDDAPPADGPLSGALSAVRDRRELRGAGWLILASCDLVRPKPGWLSPLVRAAAESGDASIAAYRGAERWQPFPSLLHTDCESVLSKAISSGARSFQQAFDQTPTIAVEWPGPDGGPPQANTHDELRSLL